MQTLFSRARTIAVMRDLFISLRFKQQHHSPHYGIEEAVNLLKKNQHHRKGPSIPTPSKEETPLNAARL